LGLRTPRKKERCQKLIVGVLVTWAIYTQGQLLLWSSLIITGVVPRYKLQLSEITLWSSTIWAIDDSWSCGKRKGFSPGASRAPQGSEQCFHVFWLASFPVFSKKIDIGRLPSQIWDRTKISTLFWDRTPFFTFSWNRTSHVTLM